MLRLAETGPSSTNHPHTMAPRVGNLAPTADSVEGKDVVTMMFEQRIPTSPKPRYTVRR